MMHFNMFEANSGRLQRELAEVEQRVNIIRRLLQQQVSTRFQDTQGIEEAIQVAEKIEALVPDLPVSDLLHTSSHVTPGSAEPLFSGVQHPSFFSPTSLFEVKKLPAPVFFLPSMAE